jgi:Domain of Unknown Function (DUF913)
MWYVACYDFSVTGALQWFCLQMKFVDAILSNNSTDDHVREFKEQGGLKPLISLLGLPNLPVDCTLQLSSQAVSSVCKSIMVICKQTNNFLADILFAEFVP